MSRGDVALILGLVFGLVMVAGAQLPVREVSLQLREDSEVYLLPPPEQLELASLGHRAALADLLWAKVLVTQGLRVEQKRRFETVGAYLDAIIHLDPKFREPYRLSDTLLTFQAVEVPLSEVYKARSVLERAVEELPNDPELWLQLGQFVAFIAAPSYLKDPAEQERWRIEGARYLARAAELGANDPNIQWQALGGFGILRRSGQREAAISFLERTLATTQDEELRQKLHAQLNAYKEDRMVERWEARKAAFARIWREHFPGRSESFVLVAGPPQRPALCAGGAHSENAAEPACSPDWASWAGRLTPETAGVLPGSR
ncbi:MAG: hypothetical protein JNL21_03650 [Myxococcales bacterium]|nr:hypothetical protein [Myxococcales bacterium]